MIPTCCDPAAPIVPCRVCGSPVHTCERAEPVADVAQIDGWDYSCPSHPDGAEIADGVWVCSPDCDSVAGRMSQIPEDRLHPSECDSYGFTSQGRDCIGRGSSCCAGCGE